MVKYRYNAWGNCTVCNSDGTPNTSSTFIGNINPFRYRGYYWDKELGLYYLHSRYYDPAICRFISLDDVDYLTPDTLGGLNLYSYCGNNPINCVYRNTSKNTISTTSGRAVPICLKNVALKNTVNDTTDKSSANPMSFAIGVMTPEKSNVPSWISIYAIYAKGTLGWGYTLGEGYSLASFSAGVLDVTFHTPKWFSSLSNDNLANPNIYFNLGTWNVNASVGIGVSGSAEIISGTVGIQFGDAISVGVKGYIGAGLTIDFTNGIRFGIGWGLGYEIFLNIDWYKLFH